MPGAGREGTGRFGQSKCRSGHSPLHYVVASLDPYGRPYNVLRGLTFSIGVCKRFQQSKNPWSPAREPISSPRHNDAPQNSESARRARSVHALSGRLFKEMKIPGFDRQHHALPLARL